MIQQLLITFNMPAGPLGMQFAFVLEGKLAQVPLWFSNATSSAVVFRALDTMQYKPALSNPAKYAP